MSAESYVALSQRHCAEIEALWERHADKLPRDEVIALSWAAVLRHKAEMRRVLN